MYHRDVIAAVARRLPHQTQRDASEVIELQDMTAGGALAAHGRLRRVYGRFRPIPSLKAKIEEVAHEQT